MKADIAAQLNAGGNGLYTAAAGSIVAGVARVAETKDGTQVSTIVATDDGVFVGDAQITDELPAEDTPAVSAPASTPPADTK